VEALENRRNPILGIFLLVLVTALWGSTFPILKVLIQTVPASVINFIRFSIACIILLPFARNSKGLGKAGLELGFWLFASFATQLIGLFYTTSNRSAFITALNVIFVPILWALAGHRVRILIWAAAGMALVGCGILSFDGTQPNLGDLWTLGTAISYAIYIIRLEIHSPKFPAISLATAQLIPILIFSAIWMLLDPAARSMKLSQIPWVWMLFLSIAATAGVICLQAVGQRMIDAPQAAVIYTLEPVFAAIIGYFMLNEVLGTRGLIGAAMILIAAAGSQTVSVKPGKNLATDIKSDEHR
jgi:drug/metabolite transporter (DMT)-like permease